MPAGTETVTVKIIGQETLSPASKKANNALKNVEKQSAKTGAALKSMAARYLGVGVAIAATVKLFKESLAAYKKQEKAEKDLAAAMKVTGTFTKQAHKEMLNFASARQKVTKFGDELTLQNMSLLQSFGMNTEEMKAATIAAQDFAAGLNIDLRTATLLVGKAFAGDTATLSRYGIKIEEGLSKSEKFTAVMQQLNKQFGGRAQAELESYEGQMTNISNRWGDITEKLGLFIAKIIKGVIPAIEGSMTALEKWGNVIKAVGVKVDEFKVKQSGISRLMEKLNLGWKSLIVPPQIQMMINLFGSATKAADNWATKVNSGFKITMAEAEKVRQSLKNIDIDTLTLATNTGTNVETIKGHWGEMTEAMQKAADVLGVNTKDALQKDVDKFTEAFRTVIGEQELSQSQMVTMRQNLFDNFEKLAGKEGAWMGIDSATLKSQSDKLSQTVLTGLTKMVDKQGKKIDESNKAFKENGDTTVAFIQSQTISTEQFINETINMVNNAVTEAVNADIDAHKDRVQVIKETAEYQVSTAQWVTFEINKQVLERERLYRQEASTAVAEANRVIAAWQIAQATIAATAGGGGEGGTIDTLHGGIDRVPRTGPYLLEEGERVVSKEENDNRSYDQSLHQDITMNVYGDNAYDSAHELKSLIAIRGAN
jgi:hypothetical protein